VSLECFFHFGNLPFLLPATVHLHDEALDVDVTDGVLNILVVDLVGDVLV
jgi:hypothetical protein